MATSGYKDKTIASYIKLRFSWQSGTANVTNNFTPINWQLQLISTNSTANINSSATKDYSVTVDGQTWNGTNTVGLNGGATKTLASGSKNIYHGTNGTKTFDFSYSQDIEITYSGSWIGTITDSGSGTLDTIPRSSVLGTINNFTIGNAITIPITQYTGSDTLNIYVGTTWVKRVEGLTNNQSVSFTSAEISSIYNAMPSTTGASFRFVNSTYSGSTVIGTSTKTAKGSIASSVKPSISSVSLAEAVSGIASTFGFYVQNKSKISGTITASTDGTGSSIDSYKTSINGVIYTGSTFTTDILNTSGSNSYSVTVTDKRGRTATSNGTFNVTAYSSPTISTLSVMRCNSDGTANDEGTYAKVNATASITSLSSKNFKSFKLQYKQKSSETWTTNYTNTSSYSLNITNRIISGISNDYPYDFRIIATDYFETDVPRNYSLSAGQPILDVKSDGKGLGIFKVSSKNAIELGKEVYDRFDTLLNNGLAVYRPGGTDADPNTSLEELVLTETNTPTSGFWYIRTLFYSNKSATSNRTQMAYPYAYNSTMKNNMYIRIYVSGIGWGAWKSINETTNATANYVGNSLVGEDLSIQWGTVIITPVANQPTQQTFNFGRTYAYPPIVIPVAATGVIGTGVMGASIVSSTTTSSTVAIYRINNVATSVHYVVIGKLA